MINRITHRLSRITHRLSALSTYFRARKLIEPFNPHWFAGKRVAIIGGADSVLDEKKGAYIDTFDVVVRVNNGVRCIESQHEYVGTRTDFLVHSFFNHEADPGSSPIEPDLWRKYNVGKILFARNFLEESYALENVRNFLKKTSYSQKFTMPIRSIHRLIGDSVKPCGPTTGFSAIQIVFMSKPLELFITGFTFMKTGSNKAYRDIEDSYAGDVAEKGHHNFEQELRCIKKICSQNNSIILDSRLNEIIAGRFSI